MTNTKNKSIITSGGEIQMINYTPLLKLLVQLKIFNLTDFCYEVGISPAFATRIKRGQGVNLQTIDKIMQYLHDNYDEEIKKLQGRELRIENILEWRPDENE